MRVSLSAATQFGYLLGYHVGMISDTTPGLKSLREAAGLTTALTARLMGLPEAAVSRLEGEACQSRPETLMRFYAAVGRHDLITQESRSSGRRPGVLVLEAAMRWEARFGEPLAADEVVAFRLKGRVQDLRWVAGSLDGPPRARLFLGELEALAAERNSGDVAIKAQFM